MSSFKEIVTKAVIGKGKKKFTSVNTVSTEQTPSTILGCWIINHNFNGYMSNNKIIIEGSYDVNIWYSSLNDTKTEVIKQTDSYKEIVNVPTNAIESSSEEVIIRSLSQPTCVNTEIKDNSIKYTIEKEMGIEIVGDTKVKISIDDDEDPWEELNDDSELDNIEEKIDKDVKEEFIE